MSNEYLTRLINSSLKDCDYEELPIKQKKLSDDNEPPNIVTDNVQNVNTIMISSIINQDEFLTSYVKNFIDVCKTAKTASNQSVDDFCYLYLDKNEELKFLEAFERTKKFDQVFKFVDATIVPRGIINNYKTVKFIDQNEQTLPIWSRKIDVFNDVVQENSEFSTKDGATFELLDENEIYLNINNNTVAELTDECNLWNDIQSSFDYSEKLSITQKTQELADDFDYLSKDQNIKKYPTDVSVTWNITNDCEISKIQHENIINSKSKKCTWQKIIDHLRSSSDGCEKTIFNKKLKELISKLVKKYMTQTKKPNIEIYNKYNIFFSIYRKKIYEYIKKLKILHSKHQDKDCSICEEYFSSKYYPYIILYLMMIYMKKPYEISLENE